MRYTIYVSKIKLLSNVTLDQKTSKEDLFTLLLKNRKIQKKDQPNFLNPPHPKNLTPKDIKLSSVQLEKALKRIQKAIEDKEKILIYGDYDVDGLTATTILWEVLFKKHANAKSFVPHREKDGYGLNEKTLKRLFKTYRPSLLITVDNGIVAHKAAAFLKKEKIDLIITDHHLPEKKLPPAHAILNSSLVCGAVLSWFLSSQIDSSADYGLAALGTVADCLPLVSVNRAFVYHGLDSLTVSTRPGLRTIKQITSLTNQKLSAYHLGFIIGPRLNAAGRVGDPNNSLRLLASPTLSQASKYAQILEKQNRERQTEQYSGQSLAQTIWEKEKTDHPLIFVSSKDFSPGTIGLIAGRLTQEHYLPSVIIAKTTPVSKASCRSIAELDILKALREANKGLLLELGGHAAAAGFSILPKNIEKFKKSLQSVVKKKLASKKLEPEIKADAKATLSFISLKNLEAIQRLKPFGIGNSEPSFLFKSLKVVDKKLLGKEKTHLKLLLDDPQTPQKETFPVESLSFGEANSYQDLKVGDTIDLVGKINLNEFRGTKTLQLITKYINVHS